MLQSIWKGRNSVHPEVPIDPFHDYIVANGQVALAKQKEVLVMATYDGKQLCEKITELYPEIGSCGIDVAVSFNTTEKTWTVDLKKDSHSLRHFLDTLDAERCMDGKQCVALGLEIAQLQKNIEGKQF
jgi:hypothetical protein